jgi:hypothetical protein
MVAIEGDIVYRFSIGGVTLRHSQGATGRIRQLFNASWRRVREMAALAAEGHGDYLNVTSSLVLPTTAAISGEAYAEIPFPTDAIAISGVRCNVNGTRWYPLKRIPFAAIHDFQYEGLFQGYAPNRGPIAYCTRLLPDGVGSTETAGVIMITPVPTSGNYRLWYLQGWQDRTADTDTIPGLADWIEWAILDTCIKMASPDRDAANQVQAWLIAREKVEKLITARAAAIEDGQPVEPRDARYDGYDPDVWRGPL